MKKALLKRKRRNPERMQRKVVRVILSKKESEKKGKYLRSKIKQELASIVKDEDVLVQV